MLFKSRVTQTILLAYLLQYVLYCVGQNEVHSVNVARKTDGDLFTRTISNGNSSNCEDLFADTVWPFSKRNCTVQCKCRTTNKTYSVKHRTCISDEQILKLENCSGSFLPNFEQPLYDLSKPGKAQLKFLDLTNRTYCGIATVAYYNGTNDVYFANNRTAGFNISKILNDSALLTWNPKNSSMISELQRYGFLVKFILLCNEMTSQEQRSCFMLKTQGRIVKKVYLTRLKEHHNICETDISNNHSNAMLLYILVGVGCGIVVIVIIVACYACNRRRRRQQSTRHVIPHLSSRSSSTGIRKAFKTRSVTKNNEPTTPAIHDVIFNELSWDGDGGFSNRALSDPRVLDVDYGIPIDFGSLPRQVRLESSTSYDSNRNSLSPLTDIGDSGQRRT